MVDTGQSKRVLGACLIQAGVIDTHAPGLVLLQHEDWVRQPLGVKDFHDEAGCEQLGDLFADCSSFVFEKTSKWLLDRLGARPDVKSMLGEFPRYARHVLWRPCEDVPVLTEELDELAFLFAAKAGSNYHELSGVGGIQGNLLTVLGRLKLDLVIRSLGLPSWQRCLGLGMGHGHQSVELAPLLDDD